MQAVVWRRQTSAIVLLLCIVCAIRPACGLQSLGTKPVHALAVAECGSVIVPRHATIQNFSVEKNSTVSLVKVHQFRLTNKWAFLRCGDILFIGLQDQVSSMHLYLCGVVYNLMYYRRCRSEVMEFQRPEVRIWFGKFDSLIYNHFVTSNDWQDVRPGSFSCFYKLLSRDIRLPFGLNVSLDSVIGRNAGKYNGYSAESSRPSPYMLLGGTVLIFCGVLVILVFPSWGWPFLRMFGGLLSIWLGLWFAFT